jgi:hypothetical protein
MQEQNATKKENENNRRKQNGTMLSSWFCVSFLLRAPVQRVAIPQN